MNSRLSRMTVSVQLWLLVAWFSLALLVLAVSSHRSTENLGSEIHSLSDAALPAVRAMTLVDMMHDGLRANVFHALLVGPTGPAAERKEILAENDEFIENMRSNVRVLAGLELNPEVKKATAAAQADLDSYMAESTRLAKLALNHSLAEARSGLPRFLELFSSLEEKLGRLGDLIAEDAQKRSESALGRATSARTLNDGLSVLCLILAWVASFWIIRRMEGRLVSVVSRLQGAVRQVSGSARSVTAASDGLAAASAQQASALQETAASLEEITAMVRKTSENSRQLEGVSQTSRRAADQGKEAVSQVLNAIDTIGAANQKIVTQVSDNNEKLQDVVKLISEIDQKTKIINDIVFQTKLLSFNASVEAARAGEHGKGFAVVAQEIGSLAEMSGSSAKDISTLLSSSLGRVQALFQEGRERVSSLVQQGNQSLQEGTRVAQNCSQALTQVVDFTSQVDGLVSEMTTAIQEQDKGLGEISTAISTIDQATNANATASQQGASTAAQLLQLADQTASIVEDLEKMVVYNRTDIAVPPAGEPPTAASPVEVRMRKAA